MRQNSDFIIKKTSTGLGLIAVKPIPKGKRLIEYFGPLLPNEIVERSNGKYYFGVNTKWSIDGSSRRNVARYINHSCKPNAEAFVSQSRRVWIWSRRKIRAGEEITYDYGKEYFEGIIEPMGCRCEKCGAKKKSRKAKKPRRK
jgi:SET domain-containing protein